MSLLIKAEAEAILQTRLGYLIAQLIWLIYTCQIPLPMLHSVTRSPPSITGSPSPLVLRTRDFIVYSLAFPTVEETEAVWDSLKALCQGVASKGIEGLYAFFYGGDSSSKGNATASTSKIYDLAKELERMGIGTRSLAWRVTRINSDFEVSVKDAWMTPVGPETLLDLSR